MVDTIVRIAHPIRIILFGSRARGVERIDSDVDLLIVQAPKEAVHRSRWQELKRIRAALREVPVAKDLLLYLRAGVLVKGRLEATTEGVPQGGPLSPLLANILLDDLDKELEKRSHHFARYADAHAPDRTSSIAGLRQCRDW